MNRYAVRIFRIAVLTAFAFTSLNGISCAEDRDPNGDGNVFCPSPSTANNNSQENLSDLMSLSYLQGIRPAPIEKNVTLFNKKAAYEGFNLYCSGHAPEAFLIDMNGNLLHRWRYDVKPTWSDINPQDNAGSRCQHAHLFENGDLIAVFKLFGLIKIDKDSKLLWEYKDQCHHETTLDSQGNIYTFCLDRVEVDGHSFFDDRITILSKDGELIKRISLFDLFKKSPYKSFIHQILERSRREDIIDVDGCPVNTKEAFHANSIDLFDGRLAKKSPLFKKGHALISIRNLGIAIIVDLEEEKILWLEGSGLWKTGQHDAQLMKNGNILLMENYYTPKRSRVIEFNPLKRKIVWEYLGDSRNTIFTPTHGLCQRLPNGNTLIIESGNGRAIEVTRQKKIVWEFINPYRSGENNELIAMIVWMKRLHPGFPLPWTQRNQLRPTNKP